MRTRWPPLLLLLLGGGYLALMLSGSIAGGSSGRDPRIALLGKEQKVFDWSRDACEPIDLPDQAARAYRDSQGQVRMFVSNYVTRGFIGSSLDTVKHTCNVALKSHLDPRPSQFDNREWLSAPYTLDGRNVYALVHQEYHGEGPRASCPSRSYNGCLYNAITLATSSDGGNSFAQAAAATPGCRGPLPVRPRLRAVRAFPAQQHRAQGRLLLHAAAGGEIPAAQTRDLSDEDTQPGRPQLLAWLERGRVQNSVRQPLHAARQPAKASLQADRVPADRRHVADPPYNTYLDRYVLIGPSGTQLPGRRGVTWGFYMSVSKDLIHWSNRRLIVKTELPWTHRCGDRDAVTYPSLLDPSSRSRNFETTGRRPYLYFTRIHYDGCRMSLDRDLIRRRVEFRK